MAENRIPIRLPREPWLAFGKSLKGAFSSSMLGDVTLVFNGGVLSINSAWGGTTLNYEGDFNGILSLKASAFKTLITAHARMKSQIPWITGAIDRELGEFSLLNAGVKAKFLG